MIPSAKSVYLFVLWVANARAVTCSDLVLPYIPCNGVECAL